MISEPPKPVLLLESRCVASEVTSNGKVRLGWTVRQVASEVRDLAGKAPSGARFRG